MEGHDEIEALRARANAHLEALLQHAIGRSPQETAASITGLAFEHGSPVRDFFAAAANGMSSHPPQSPRNILKSRSSRSILRFSRGSKSGLPDIKPPMSSHSMTPDVNNVGAPSTGRMSTKAVPMSSCFSTAPRPIRGSASTQYQCIICDEFLSSKGVCKRHLEDQHVSPKQYKCEKCAMLFAVKSKCKEHIKDCGKGVFLYVVCKPEEKRAYACEFTGDVFSSMARYVEHLLSLSERTEDRPAADLHRKLHALLCRTHVEPHVTEISSRVLRSSSAWRDLYWDGAQLAKAIEILEHATAHENGTLELPKHVTDGQKVQSTETFVYGLLCEGNDRRESRNTIRPGSRKDAMSRSSSTSFGSVKTITPKASLNAVTSAPIPAPPISIPETTSIPHMPTIPSATMAPGVADAVAQVSADVKNKRHLSDHSRYIIPDRVPPGPPVPPNFPHMYDLNADAPTHPPTYNSSTTSLPLRPPDALPLVDQTSVPMDYQPRQVYTPSIETTGSSDAASVSTLMSNYQEPELVTPMSFDYNHMWQGQPNPIPFSLPPPNHNTAYHAPPNPEYYYHHPSISSTRTPSIATDQTYVADYNVIDQKPLNFDTGPTHAVSQLGSFLWTDEDAHEENRMH